MRTDESFRETIMACDAAIAEVASWSLVEQLQLDEDAPAWRLGRIDVIQPALVALALAYAASWRARGVVPDAIVGHSMGEVGAACLAGVIDVRTAMHLICRRSTLMYRTSGRGAMAVLGLTVDEARARLRGLEDRVTVAVSNSPRSTVISGDPDAVREVVAAAERDGVFARLVKVDVASHSPQMETLEAQGIPLGMFAGIEYGHGTEGCLEDGDILALFTDGFYEWENPEGEEFGVTRLEAVLREARDLTAEEMVASLRKAVADFCRGTEQKDDLTAVILQRKAKPAAIKNSADLESELLAGLQSPKQTPVVQA